MNLKTIAYSPTGPNGSPFTIAPAEATSVTERADFGPLITAIPKARDSVAAILRWHVTELKALPGGPGNEVTVECGWGTGFCVVADRYLVTAHHVLNDRKPRSPGTKFYALVVPGNGDPFHVIPVVGFPVERPDIDIAVLELGTCSQPGVHLPAVPVSFSDHADGSHAMTIGFPAPQIAGVHNDNEGNFLGGQLFLKSHANEGIIAAQYALPGVQRLYELNIGWHHGESGGPILTASERPAAFALMQHYRNVQGPNGILPGPHRGIALSAIKTELERLGAMVA